ncbi:MAG TPA: GcrA family cell cycle regulator [Sphingobium sp.]|uniref:GcrA family cell cycle regulator n=1 Tax=Sphingobium sp. TaxID=1912891 RepID=UPI002ECFEE16
MAWTNERIDQLKTMWERGMTASQIAEELGGVSRNAVIGKAHRLGLQARPSPVKSGDSTPKAAAARKPAPEAAPAPVAAVPASPAPKPSIIASAPAPTPVAPVVAVPAPVAPVAEASSTEAPAAPQPRIISVGPGGFLRQGPGEQQQPIPPAPPRRLVPAKPSPEIADKTSLLDLTEKICKWPVGHPGEPDFHFCGVKVNPGFPYCVEHCGRAYQAQLPRGTRRPPPPLPFGGPRVR